MKVLVVYEYVPEDTNIYLLDIDGPDLAKAKKAHGVYVNSSKNDKAAIWLEEFLKDKDKLKVKPGKPFDALGVELVIHSGFLL